MPSNSLIRWNGERAEALDEIENAHAEAELPAVEMTPVERAASTE
jgi:hypothetical protein